MSLNEHELDQRLSEAAWPMWMKLQWLEETSRFALHLRDAPRVDPPEWAQEEMRKALAKRAAGTSPQSSASEAKPGASGS
jgi:hypothetical protein